MVINNHNKNVLEHITTFRHFQFKVSLSVQGCKHRSLVRNHSRDVLKHVLKCGHFQFVKANEPGSSLLCLYFTKGLSPDSSWGLKSLRVGEKHMNNWWGNGILIQGWDQAQIVLRKPQMSSDKSQSFLDDEAIKPRL